MSSHQHGQAAECRPQPAAWQTCISLTNSGLQSPRQAGRWAASASTSPPACPALQPLSWERPAQQPAAAGRMPAWSHVWSGCNERMSKVGVLGDFLKWGCNGRISRLWPASGSSVQLIMGHTCSEGPCIALAARSLGSSTALLCQQLQTWAAARHLCTARRHCEAGVTAAASLHAAALQAAADSTCLGHCGWSLSPPLCSCSAWHLLVHDTACCLIL